MSKMTMNDDGTVTIPLLPVDGGPPVTEVTLREPDFDALCEIMEMVDAADGSLPEAQMLPPGASPEEVRALTAVLRDRNKQTFSQAGPYIDTLIRTIKLLSDQDVTRKQLPGWAGSPRTMQALLTHFQSPLPGGE